MPLFTSFRAFPVPGPIDVIREGSTGAMDENLAAAVYRALSLDGEACIEFAQYHSWQRSVERFLRIQKTREELAREAAPSAEQTTLASCEAPGSRAR